MEDREVIYNLIINGIECGAPYTSFNTEGDWEKAWRAAEEGFGDSFAGITLTDRYADDGEECDPAGPPIALTDEALAEGWKRFQKEAPSHWVDAVAEEDDALTGDAFLQILAFGEIVYA